MDPVSGSPWWVEYWDDDTTTTHRSAGTLRTCQRGMELLRRSPELAELNRASILGNAATGIREYMYFDGHYPYRTKPATNAAIGRLSGWGAQYSERDTQDDGMAGTNWTFKMLEEVRAALAA
ncbi:hypothetical protein SAMN06295912_1251 [Sphingomonas laterariae]|uniref:Uncharacterized protein n=1 Tax=Edaphosphingomonas laterariae TaxID=861865 RepID=A0A239II50_9SPHN|nr:hypothetical protein [Sphingomonas laterariae]SNS93426.1 hypothetical protein SAMN06295912_1251 [Sphingomonas laterariae]